MKLAFYLFVLWWAPPPISAKIYEDGACPLFSLLPFTPGYKVPREVSVDFNYQYNPWNPVRSSKLSFSYAAAILLAVDHFNQRDHSVVPELAELVDSECTVYFPEPTFADSKNNKVASVQALWQHMSPRRPFCGALSPLMEDVALKLLPPLQALDIPLLVHWFENDWFASDDNSAGSASFTLSAVGKAQAMVEYLSSRKYLAHYYPDINQEESLAEALQRIGREAYDLQTYLFEDEEPPKGVDNIEFKRQKLEQIKLYGATTIVVAIREPHEMPGLAQILDSLDMLTRDYIYILPVSAIPLDDREHFNNLYGPQKKGSPLDKLLSGALVFDRVDGFDFRKEDPFQKAWKRQSADQVYRLNALVPKSSWLHANPNYFQTIMPSRGASFVYDSVIALGLGACEKQRLDRENFGGNKTLDFDDEGPPEDFDVPDGLFVVSSSEEQVVNPDGTMFPSQTPSMKDVDADPDAVTEDEVDTGSRSENIPDRDGTLLSPEITPGPSGLLSNDDVANTTTKNEPMLILDQANPPQSEQAAVKSLSPQGRMSRAPSSIASNMMSRPPAVKPVSILPSPDPLPSSGEVNSSGSSTEPDGKLSSLDPSAAEAGAPRGGIPSFEPGKSPSSHPPAVEAGVPSGFHSVASSFPAEMPATTNLPSTTQTSSVPSAMLSGVPSIESSQAPSTEMSEVQSQGPSDAPTLLHSSIPSIGPSQSPSTEPSQVPSDGPTVLHSEIPSFEPSQNPRNRPSLLPSNFPTSSPMPSGSPSYFPTELPTITNSPTVTASSMPSDAPTVTNMPSTKPSRVFSDAPTVWSSQMPSIEPSQMLSSEPSIDPTVLHSSARSKEPSNFPSTEQSDVPSDGPTVLHSSFPSHIPSDAPTKLHSQMPSIEHSQSPSTEPSQGPSDAPTLLHSSIPSIGPSQSPSTEPSQVPSDAPTVLHSEIPSFEPSQNPSNRPSVLPSNFPTSSPMPSGSPSYFPTELPTITNSPTVTASSMPSDAPTITNMPSTKPSVVFSDAPTVSSSQMPSIEPSQMLSSEPSIDPTVLHSSAPSNEPSNSPSTEQSDVPSDGPTVLHSEVPSFEPSQSPSSRSSSLPSDIPTMTSVLLIDENKNPIAYIDGYLMDVAAFTKNLGVTVQLPNLPGDRHVDFYLDNSLLDFDNADSLDDDNYRIGPSSTILDRFQALNAGEHEVRIEVPSEGLTYVVSFEVINAPTTAPSNMPSASPAPTTVEERGLKLLNKNGDVISLLDGFELDLATVTDYRGFNVRLTDGMVNKNVEFFLDGVSIDTDTSDATFLAQVGPNSGIKNSLLALEPGLHVLSATVIGEGITYVSSFDVINAPTSFPSNVPSVSPAPTTVEERGLKLLNKNGDVISLLDGFELDLATVTDYRGFNVRLTDGMVNKNVEFFLDGVSIDTDTSDATFLAQVGPNSGIKNSLLALEPGLHVLSATVIGEGITYVSSFDVINAPTSFPSNVPSVSPAPTTVEERGLKLLNKNGDVISLLDGFELDLATVTDYRGFNVRLTDGMVNKNVEFFLDGVSIDTDTSDATFLAQVGPNSGIKNSLLALEPGLHVLSATIIGEGITYVSSFNVINAPTSFPSNVPSVSPAPTTVEERGLKLLNKNGDVIALLDGFVLDLATVTDYRGFNVRLTDGMVGKDVEFFVDGVSIGTDTSDATFLAQVGPNSGIKNCLLAKEPGSHVLTATVIGEGITYVSSFDVINAPTSFPSNMPSVSPAPTTAEERGLKLLNKNGDVISLLDGFELDLATVTDYRGFNVRLTDGMVGKNVEFFLDGVSIDTDTSDATFLAQVGPNSGIKDSLLALEPGTHVLTATVIGEGITYVSSFDVKSFGGLLLIDGIGNEFLLDGAFLDLAVLGLNLAIRAQVPPTGNRVVSFHFGSAHALSDSSHEYQLGPSSYVENLFQTAGNGTHTVNAVVFPSGISFTATFTTINTPSNRRERNLQSNFEEAGRSLLESVLRSKFTGASGFVDFGKENARGRNADGITVGVYNVRTNTESGNQTYSTELVSTWQAGSGWNSVPGTGLIYRDGSTVSTSVLRKIWYHNYISFPVRVIGLCLMSFAWTLSMVSFILIGWLRQDLVVQRAQPAFMQLLCVGSVILSSSIFTLSWDENAGWSNKQLSVACSLTPWFFFTGHILIFSCLFIRLWRLDQVFQKTHNTAVSVVKAMVPLATFLIAPFVILLAQTVYDPWSWERHIIKEIPAETYGKCQSHNVWAFFGPLVGLVVTAEAATLYIAWRTKEIPEDFRDSESIMFVCLAHTQAWAVGVPMLAAIGYESADATYFARIFLTWIFSVSSVGVIACPKIFKAIQGRRHPHKNNQKGRVKVSAVCEQSSSRYDDYSSSLATKKVFAQQRQITKSEFKDIQEAADEVDSEGSLSTTKLYHG